MLKYEFIDPEEQITSDDFNFVETFLKSTGRTQIGWHYITDITWIYSRVKNWPHSTRILDAGGGHGPLQFLLAELGFDVTNIDMALSKPPNAYAKRYSTRFYKLPSYSSTSYMHLIANQDTIKSRIRTMIKESIIFRLIRSIGYKHIHDKWRNASNLRQVRIGSLQWIAGNLCDMPEIEDASFDAVVSLSALEHVPIDQLDGVITTISRVLKPSAEWAVTTSGTERSRSWYHESSQGYCFSVTDIEKIGRAHV